MSKILIIGAGPMGLASAYYAAKAGHAVEVIEAGDRPGGMAAHFDFGGLSLERFYHFCCLGDADTLALMADLEMPEPMKWVTTRMGYFVDGKLHRFGDPLSLLMFPALGPIEKLRYGLMAFWSTRRSDWSKLDGMTAKDWFTAWCGTRVYEKLWRPLFHLKFFEFAESISAAWVWQRIKRLGNSRRSIFEERLGYIEGGSESLVVRLVEAINRLGGRMKLDAPARRILIQHGVVRGVEIAGGETLTADVVICTAPLPYVPSLLVDAPQLAESYSGFDNVGVVCVIHKLRRSVSGYFWVNISDPEIEIPGFVEFSNLRPMREVIVYVPYYMPTDHPKFGWSDEALAAESFGYLRKVNPALSPADRIDVSVSRLRHAQPVCGVGFASKLPPFLTPVNGLMIADTSFYYPEDRGVSESVRFAKRMIESLGAGVSA